MWFHQQYAIMDLIQADDAMEFYHPVVIKVFTAHLKYIHCATSLQHLPPF